MNNFIYDPFMVIRVFKTKQKITSMTMNNP